MIRNRPSIRREKIPARESAARDYSGLTPGLSSIISLSVAMPTPGCIDYYPTYFNTLHRSLAHNVKEVV
jgi:hypothetical protein